MTSNPFTHLRGNGSAHMVDVTTKTPTVRVATAECCVECSEPIMPALRDESVPKGDVISVARIAGIQATKHTPDLIPLAHRIGVHGAEVDLWLEPDRVRIRATTRTTDRTGVEMEALTAVTVAALTVADMVKGVDRGFAIEHAVITHKAGGRSGEWTRSDDQ